MNANSIKTQLENFRTHNAIGNPTHTMCVMIAVISTSHENAPRFTFESGITTQYINPYTKTPYTAPATHTLLNKNPIFRLVR